MSVAALLHPELVVRAADYHVAVEAESELTRGYAAMSWGVHGLSPNARVVEEADGAAFYAYVKEFLATTTEPSRPFAR